MQLLQSFYFNVVAFRSRLHLIMLIKKERYNHMYKLQRTESKYIDTINYMDIRRMFGVI